MQETFPAEGFARLEYMDDSEFYIQDRFVEQLDYLALSKVEKLVGELLGKKLPCSWISWRAGIPTCLPGSGPPRLWVYGSPPGSWPKIMR